MYAFMESSPITLTFDSFLFQERKPGLANLSNGGQRKSRPYFIWTMPSGRFRAMTLFHLCQKNRIKMFCWMLTSKNGKIYAFTSLHFATCNDFLQKKTSMLEDFPRNLQALPILRQGNWDGFFTPMCLTYLWSIFFHL